MAGRLWAQNGEQGRALPVEDYRHSGATRPNNPPAAIAAEGRTPPAPEWPTPIHPDLTLRFAPMRRAEQMHCLRCLRKPHGRN